MFGEGGGIVNLASVLACKTVWQDFLRLSPKPMVAVTARSEFEGFRITLVQGGRNRPRRDGDGGIGKCLGGLALVERSQIGKAPPGQRSERPRGWRISAEKFPALVPAAGTG